jgi:regulatory protein
MTTQDPVDQARAWLTEQTGRPAPGGAGSAGPLRDETGTGRESSQEQRRQPSRRRGQGEGSGADADADPEDVARAIALRKLTGQARTRHELAQALQKKNVPEEVAAVVLDRLEQVGLVDDGAFAHDWVESRQRRRHLSRSALRRELQLKGVDRDQVDAALATVDTDAELAAARELVAKKQGAGRGVDPLVRRRRLAGALARRGFGSGIIATVLGEVRDVSADDPGA